MWRASGLVCVVLAVLPLTTAHASKAAYWSARAEAATDTVARGEALRRAAKSEPDNLDARFAWARFAATNGLPTVAAAELDALHDRAPDNLEIATYRGRTMTWRSEWEAAAEALDAVLRQDPTWVDAWIVRGDVELWQGHASAALPFYEQAAARAPADPVVEQKLLQAHAASSDDGALLTFLRARPAADDSVERQRLRRAAEHRAAPVRVDTGAVYTVTEREDWGAFSLVASGRPHPRWTLHAGSQWQQRGASPALRDTSVEAGVRAQVSDPVAVHAGGMGTPGAHFAPVWGADAGLDHEVRPRLAWGVSARHRSYTQTSATTLAPSITVSPWRLSLQSMALLTRTASGSWTAAGRLATTFDATAAQRLELWLQVGREPLDPLLSRLFDEPRQGSVMLALASDVGTVHGLRFHYAYTSPLRPSDRRLLPSRHAIGVVWTTRVRARVARAGRRP